MTRQKKRSQRGRQKRSGAAFGNVSPTAEPVPCDYCGAPFWRLRSDQRYHDPGSERKLAWQRRNALVELLLVTLRARCGMTLAVARRMVELAERALLDAVRRLGWVWQYDSRRFEWRAA